MSFIVAYEFETQFANLDSMIEAIQDQEGICRLSAISPDMCVQMARDEHMWGAGMRGFCYGELAYDMWGNPGNVSLCVHRHKDPDTGCLRVQMAWNPLNLSL